MKLQQAGFDLKNMVLFFSDYSNEHVVIMKICLLALMSLLSISAVFMFESNKFSQVSDDSLGRV